jgi:hypothetical protein
MELVDARQFLPLMRCRRGMPSWFVLDDSKVGNTSSSASNNANGAAGANTDSDAAAPTADNDQALPAAVRDCLEKGFRLFRSVADVPDSHNMRKRYRQSLFPPTPEEAEWMHLGE